MSGAYLELAEVRQGAEGEVQKEEVSVSSSGRPGGGGGKGKYRAQAPARTGQSVGVDSCLMGLTLRKI